MRTFRVREFFDNPRSQWPCGDREKFNVIFDDGITHDTNTYRMEVSRKFWLVHEEFDRLPILSDQHIGWGPLPQKRVQSILMSINRGMFEVYGRGNYDREHIWYLLYKTSERIFNEAIVEYSEYVRSIGSFEFQEVYDYPPIVAIREGIRPTPLSIDNGLKAASKVMMTDDHLARCPLISDLRAALVKEEQALQNLIYRGWNTDIDSHLYNFPITGNYYAGIKLPAEAMMESTLAAKSYIFTGAPLEQTEYANRKMQFSSHAVDLLFTGDCGQTDLAYIDVIVDKPREIDRLRDMNGLFFLDESIVRGPKLRPIDSAVDKHLIGQRIGVRLPFNCLWRHHSGVCSTCYGLLSENIPYGTNIGHVASTMTQSEVSQRVMKIKHSESSVTSDPFVVNQSEREFIRAAENHNQICLQPELLKKGVVMLLKSAAKDNVSNASKLPTLQRSDYSGGKNISKISQFRDVSFDIPKEGKRPLRLHVSVSRGQRMSYLTPEFLQFFMDKEFRIHHDGLYHIDLEGWDFDKPVFELPNRHTSMKDYATEVEVFARSTQDSSDRHLGRLKQLAKYTDPTEALLDFHTLISPKVPAPFTHLAVVMLALMAPADNRRDFRIPEYGKPTRFAKYDHVMDGRSLGAKFAYQGGRDCLEDIEQYMNTERDAHLMDKLLMPLW